MSATPAPLNAPAPPTPGPLPRPYLTPPCKVGADRWPDLHQQCSAPGYQHRTLGWVPVACGCTCHVQADGEVQG